MLKKFIILVLFFIWEIECKVDVIAHRGACSYLPEHTFESKIAAILMGADYIEQDVVLTKDNVPIVLHDIHLDEVTNVAQRFPSRSRRINNETRYYAIDFTYDEIKTLKVSERFHYENISNPIFSKRFPIWRSSFQLNSLEEEIQLVQGFSKSTEQSGNQRIIGLYVEIKRPDFHKIEQKGNFSEIVLDLLAKYNYKKKTDRCIIQCFDPFELKRIRKELNSELTLVQLLQTPEFDYEGINTINYTYWNSEKGLEEIASFADGIGPEKDQLIVYDEITYKVSPSNLHQIAKSLNLFMHPYTFRFDRLPKYASDYTQLLKVFIVDLKVEGLFTDFTDLTVNYLASKNSSSCLNFSKYFFIIMLLTSIFLF